MVKRILLNERPGFGELGREGSRFNPSWTLLDSETARELADALLNLMAETGRKHDTAIISILGSGREETELALELNEHTAKVLRPEDLSRLSATFRLRSKQRRTRAFPAATN